MTRLDRYAVVGNPVEHSRSPEIHAAFAQQTGEGMSYGRLLAPLDDFVGTVERFFVEGGCGLNVTLPFKEEAFAWVDEHDEFAGAAGAVNTIVRVAGAFRGCNTDGVGLVRDLEVNLGAALAGQRILVLGAGGAVRGVLGPLLGRAPREVVLVNRTRPRAAALVDRFEDPRLRAADWNQPGDGFDVVINGTSASTKGGELSVAREAIAGAFVYDMAYGGAARRFLDWSRASGAVRVSDGLGMLVEQAAEAFWLWRGVRPDSFAVLNALRRRL
jgi:shikimate dehydrogenase